MPISLPGGDLSISLSLSLALFLSVCTCVCMCVCVCVYVVVCVCRYMYVQVYMCICVHTYSCTHTHTHTHSHSICTYERAHTHTHTHFTSRGQVGHTVKGLLTRGVLWAKLILDRETADGFPSELRRPAEEVPSVEHPLKSVGGAVPSPKLEKALPGAVAGASSRHHNVSAK